ncbi:MAG: hypothetical protein JWL73_2292 [Actinomycetia bacterium]|nr:hypothetical protein [Actinomycetes bacterium]
MLTKWNGLLRALVVTAVATSVGLVGAGPAVAAPSPSTTTSTTSVPAKVADACSLLKPKDVKAALKKASKAFRPIRVSAGIATSPTTAGETARSCALAVLLPKNVGGSVQVLASPTRAGVCPPKAVKKSDRKKVAGKTVVLIRSGKKNQLSGAVFAKKGTCVSVATVLSNGKATPTASYVALARTALGRL